MRINRLFIMLLAAGTLVSCGEDDSVLTENIGNKEENNNSTNADSNNSENDNIPMFTYSGMNTSSSVVSENPCEDATYTSNPSNYCGFTLEYTTLPQATETRIKKSVSNRFEYCTLTWNGTDKATIHIKNCYSTTKTLKKCFVDKVYYHPVNLSREGYIAERLGQRYYKATLTVTETDKYYHMLGNSGSSVNPFTITEVYSSDEWEETSEETVIRELTYELSVGKINEYKYIMSNSEVEFTFDPIGGTLSQTKGERNNFKLTKQQ